MATNNEIAYIDVDWEEMKSLAMEQQQDFYECVFECKEYKENEHQYLKHDISCAIFGLPTSTKDASTTKKDNCYWKPENTNDLNADITDTIEYEKEALNVRDVIYKQICECTTGNTNNTEPIYSGIIYNVIFRPKMNVKPKKKEVNKETEKETEEDELVKQEEKFAKIQHIPIFTIRRNIQKELIDRSNHEQSMDKNALSHWLGIGGTVFGLGVLGKSAALTKAVATNKKQKKNTTKEQADYETWYIDIFGRVYKSWEDYMESNYLPECTMVLPKDGVYQADKSCPVTEDYSTVWLEVRESPACRWTKKICSGIDIASNIAGVGAASLGVAALFTPLGPAVAVTSLVATGVTSAWTVGRSSQQLIDRSNHEQSINPMDKNALPHWLGIAGSTFGLGVVGGSAALTKAAASGRTIPTFAKAAFNTVQGGNLIINGFGIVYQSYCLIDKYRTEQTVNRIDALYLAMHVMFFAGSVVKIQFANDIIESTQGKVINDYKDTLHKRNLRKKFNRAVRRAAENNTSKISENAEVIQYIKHREQILSANQPVSLGQTLEKNSHNIVWSLEHGKLKVNGIILLDPFEFVRRLREFNFNESNSSVSRNDDNSINAQLVKLLLDLLTKFYSSDACPRSENLPTISDFETLIKEMSSMKIDEESLKKIFNIVEKLMKCSRKEDFLLPAFRFVWQYCKANLKQWGIHSYYRMQSNSGSNVLKNIIAAVSEAINMIINNLCCAFEQYLKTNLNNYN
ncbi:uncharacterized protein LOC114931895 [Nylanderia fulva]|uniref:uncharacterized protein LOC114931895 n=1 Tax=Nylanderia fulva TaxID=613905 RepID=UPI0010FAF9D1|nr:uncharacterized protein LOC114931895 [Nylanderia fulva]XP_029159869.1 uncharacterized protein LOC114931895 [Nylanderia fulva]